MRLVGVSGGQDEGMYYLCFYCSTDQFSEDYSARCSIPLGPYGDTVTFTKKDGGISIENTLGKKIMVKFEKDVSDDSFTKIARKFFKCGFFLVRSYLPVAGIFPSQFSSHNSIFASFPAHRSSVIRKRPESSSSRRLAGNSFQLATPMNPTCLSSSCFATVPSITASLTLSRLPTSRARKSVLELR